MGLFKSILDKLGLGKKKEEAAPAAPAVAKPIAPTPLEQSYIPKPSAAPAPKPSFAPAASVAAPKKAEVSEPKEVEAPKIEAMEMVDVVAKLEAMARSAPAGLDWKVSIVDLLKLLGIDHSYEARKELATELGCPAELMGESAKMNTWLHKTVLQKIAENGGNIPASLLN